MTHRTAPSGAFSPLLERLSRIALSSALLAPSTARMRGL